MTTEHKPQNRWRWRAFFGGFTDWRPWLAGIVTGLIIAAVWHGF